MEDKKKKELEVKQQPAEKKPLDEKQLENVNGGLGSMFDDGQAFKFGGAENPNKKD